MFALYACLIFSHGLTLWSKEVRSKYEAIDAAVKTQTHTQLQSCT